MATTKATKLLCSELGRIGCECPGHAPFPGTDTWRSGRWRPITRNERVEFEAEVGRAPECESCTAVARRDGERS